MKINVKIRKLFKDAGALKAVASVTLEDEFVVHGVKVVESDKGRFMLMPSESFKKKDNKEVSYDVFHPVNSTARSEMQAAVFAAYEEAVDKTNTENAYNGENN